MRRHMIAASLAILALCMITGAGAQQQGSTTTAPLPPKVEAGIAKIERQLRTGQIDSWQIWLVCRKLDGWTAEHGWNFDALPMKECMKITKKPAKILDLPRPDEAQCHEFIREHLAPLLPALHQRFAHYCW